MRIDLCAVGVLACMVAPGAAAQTAMDPRLGPAPVLSASITQTDTGVTGVRMRRRAGSAMTDFYPAGGTGFHVSAGLRLFESRSVARRNMGDLRGLIANPRSMGNSGLRSGYRRVPSIAAGYTQPVSDDVNFSVEVGAMTGHALNIRRVGPRRMYDRESGVNPIAHIVLNARF